MGVPLKGSQLLLPGCAYLASSLQKLCSSAVASSESDSAVVCFCRADGRSPIDPRTGLFGSDPDKAAWPSQQSQASDFVGLGSDGAAWPASCLAGSNQTSPAGWRAVYLGGCYAYG